MSRCLRKLIYERGYLQANTAPVAFTSHVNPTAAIDWRW